MGRPPVTLDQLQQRDREIARLEAIGDARTIAEQDELIRLVGARDHQWRRLGRAIDRARRRARDLETWARQHNLPLERIRA